jgi:hypothetical protein
MTGGADEQNIVLLEALVFWVAQAQAFMIGASADHARTSSAPYHNMAPVATHEAILE